MVRAVTLLALLAFAVGAGGDTARAIATDELSHQTADWVFRMPSELGTQADLELVAHNVQSCTEEIRKLVAHRPARERFEMRWVVDGGSVSNASNTGVVNRVPAGYRIVSEPVRAFKQRLAAGDLCFGPHEITHVLTWESFRIAWANEGFATLTDRLYDSANWRLGDPLRPGFSCGATGYTFGNFVGYSNLSRFDYTTAAYHTGACFWLEVLQRGGFEAIRATLARMRANPPATTGRLVTCHAGAVLGADLKPVAARYGFTDNDLAVPCTFPLTLAVEGGAGSVSAAPAVVPSCTAKCSVDADAGLSVTLTASPAEGDTFAGWSGACTGTATTCVVAMEAARSVTATFVRHRELTIERPVGGRVTSDPGGIACPDACSARFPFGSSVRLTAAAGAGHRFGGWAGSCRGTGVCTVVIGDTQAVTARFVPQVVLSLRIAGGGSVLDCQTACRFTFDAGERLVLRAEPLRGYRFASWGGACRGRAVTCALRLGESALVTARFVRR